MRHLFGYAGLVGIAVVVLRISTIFESYQDGHLTCISFPW